MLDAKKIAVLGAGTMGPGIAQTYAAAGYEVWLYSRTEKTLQRAQSLIGSSLQFLAEEEMVEDAQSTAARIHYTTDIAQAVQATW